VAPFPETSVALPPPVRYRRDRPPAMTFYVHEHNHVLPHCAFRVHTPDDVLRHRGRGAGGPDVTRSRCAPSTRGGEPIRVLREVPVTQRGRVTPWPAAALSTTASRTHARRGGAGESGLRAVHESGGRTGSGIRVAVHRSTLAALSGENSRANSRMSVKIARLKTPKNIAVYGRTSSDSFGELNR
jgi:hypothetical protein